MRKIFETILSSRNLIRGINIWADTLRKILGTIHKLVCLHHPRDDVDRQYVSRKEEGRRQASVRDSAHSSIKQLQGAKERLIKIPEATQTTQGSTENQLESKYGKKSNFMDISSNKQAISHMTRLGQG